MRLMLRHVTLALEARLQWFSYVHSHVAAC